MSPEGTPDTHWTDPVWPWNVLSDLTFVKWSIVLSVLIFLGKYGKRKQELLLCFIFQKTLSKYSRIPAKVSSLDLWKQWRYVNYYYFLNLRINNKKIKTLDIKMMIYGGTENFCISHRWNHLFIYIYIDL